RMFSQLLFHLMRRCHASPPLFPYTTLFRSFSPHDKSRGQCPRLFYEMVAGGAACCAYVAPTAVSRARRPTSGITSSANRSISSRSEEHTSELQSLRHLVCRLLLEKKNRNSC